MSAKILKSDDTVYLFNEDNRNIFYLHNNNVPNIEENIRTLKKGFKHLGFFRNGKTMGRRILTTPKDYTEVVGTTNFTKTDCTAFILLSDEESMSGHELNYLEAFYSNKNTELECKPRIFIFLYQKNIKRSRDETDSSSVEYSLPIQADLLVIQLIVPDIGLAAQEIGKHLLNIKQDDYCNDDIIKFMKKIEGSEITVTSTLTRRLYFKPKKEMDPEQKRKSFIMRRNNLLLFQISQIQEMEEGIINIDKIIDDYKLDEVGTELNNNIHATIPNREKLITNLENYIVTSNVEYQPTNYYRMAFLFIPFLFIYFVYNLKEHLF